jgi:hypothetical protein
MDELQTCDGWRTPANAWVPCWRAPDFTVAAHPDGMPVFACRRHLASAVDRETEDYARSTCTVTRL